MDVLQEELNVLFWGNLAELEGVVEDHPEVGSVELVVDFGDVGEEVGDWGLVEEDTSVAEITGVQKGCLGLERSCGFDDGLLGGFEMEFLNVLLKFAVNNLAKELDLKDLLLEYFITNARVVLNNFDITLSSLAEAAEVSLYCIGSCLRQPAISPALYVNIVSSLFCRSIL